jgi:hypothetical protein
MRETYHESGGSAETAVGVLCQVQRWMARLQRDEQAGRKAVFQRAFVLCNMAVCCGDSAALLGLRLYSANQREALST